MLPSTDDVVELASCMEDVPRGSSQGRPALHELLDEVEVKVKPLVSQTTAPRPHTPTGSSEGRLCDDKPLFGINPADYGWSWKAIEGDVSFFSSVFERTFPAAIVTMRCFYANNTVQLEYPVECYSAQVVGQEVHGSTWYGGEKGGRLVQEKFGDVDRETFKQMLNDAPKWFGKGSLVISKPESAVENDNDNN